MREVDDDGNFHVLVWDIGKCPLGAGSVSRDCMVDKILSSLPDTYKVNDLVMPCRYDIATCVVESLDETWRETVSKRNKKGPDR